MIYHILKFVILLLATQAYLVTANVVFPDMREVKATKLANKATTECVNVTTSWCYPQKYPNKAIAKLIKKNNLFVSLLEKEDNIEILSSHPAAKFPETFEDNICFLV